MVIQVRESGLNWGVRAVDMEKSVCIRNLEHGVKEISKHPSTLYFTDSQYGIIFKMRKPFTIREQQC